MKTSRVSPEICAVLPVPLSHDLFDLCEHECASLDEARGAMHRIGFELTRSTLCVSGSCAVRAEATLRGRPSCVARTTIGLLSLPNHRSSRLCPRLLCVVGVMRMPRILED